MFSTVVVSSYLYFLRRELGERHIEERRNHLTVRPKFAEGVIDSVELFNDRSALWFGVPLYDSPFALTRMHALAKNVKDIRIVVRAKIGMRTKLYSKQQNLVDEFRKFVDSGITGFLVEAKPGFGKTVCAINMMSILGLRTLVVVPRSNLIAQWISRLKQHSTLNPSEIGWVEGGKGDWIGKKVVVGLVHSLGLDRMGRGFKKNFGTIIFDEVDRSVPPATFAPVVSMFPAKYRIGLSATIKRQDGMEVVLEKHIGQKFLRGEDENRMKPKIAMVYFDQSSGFVPNLDKKLNRRGILISRLASNPARNQMLSSLILRIYKSGRRCLVLSDRKIQLQVLRRILMLLGVSSSKVGFYVRSIYGKTLSADDLKQVSRHCDIILATYGMIALGTDIPDLAGLVYATPQSETEQSKGRIERFVAGKKQPIVVDVVDTAYYDTIGWANKRHRHYKRNDLEIKSINTKH